MGATGVPTGNRTLVRSAPVNADAEYRFEIPIRRITRGKSIREEPQGIAGWLLVYLIVLAFLVVHGIGLTVASIIIYSNPSIAGLHTFMPLGALLYYIFTNVAVALYTVVLFVLMFRRRHSAIANNIAFNILSASVVVSWHLLGEKSPIGTVIDVLPYLLGLCYVLTSKRVRNTFRVGIR
jgi:Protein of unknown function (DUF2569)